ncbi:hypothetical protein O1611_g7585 [Lasiodiplodia mahajangana]|uniref:Uncharacterized protein n=1 Tax=Lasiodiplodia mahajangana TaxID=1108764 RepID=A0ACC2JFC8_9PEZI|nr:hypothetical protein O1611_g7585 [Lasiodiplodia mahajangana]
MASSSGTVGSSPSSGDSPPTSLDSEQRPPAPIREWTQFELDTVCALICKHEELTFKADLKTRSRRGKKGGGGSDDWALQFATNLNEALHGIHGYKYDIPVDDVRELMDFIETKNASVMAYIKRQMAPFRITRSTKYAFQRLCYDFNFAFYDWTVIRRERRQNPNMSDAEISQRSRVYGHFSSQNKGESIH